MNDYTGKNRIKGTAICMLPYSRLKAITRARTDCNLGKISCKTIPDINAQVIP